MNLSYILTTFNKLNYLKVTLPALINACQNDEEIVVIDGGSNDGTFDYLNELYLNKKIHQFVSEKDFGEAHGYNKAMLIAKGELIKIISDDDVFDYSEINECKEFMLKHKQFDALASNVIQANILDKQRFNCKLIKQAELNFLNWKNKKSNNTFFCGLSLMMRKNSIPLLGLFNNYFKMVDLEFCVRITSLNTKIVFFTNPLVVSTINENSNSSIFNNKYERELLKISFSYEYFNTYLTGQKFYNPYSLKETSKYFFKLLQLKFSKNHIEANNDLILSEFIFNSTYTFEEVFQNCNTIMLKFNANNKGVFIEKEN